MKHRNDLIWNYVSKDIAREDFAHHEFDHAVNQEWLYGVTFILPPAYTIRRFFDRRTGRDTRPVHDRLRRSWINTVRGMVGEQFYADGVK